MLVKNKKKLILLYKTSIMALLLTLTFSYKYYASANGCHDNNRFIQYQGSSNNPVEGVEIKANGVVIIDNIYGKYRNPDQEEEEEVTQLDKDSDTYLNDLYQRASELYNEIFIDEQGNIKDISDSEYIGEPNHNDYLIINQEIKRIESQYNLLQQAILEPIRKVITPPPPPPPPRSVENRRVVNAINKGNANTADIDRLVKESLKSNKTHNGVLNASVNISNGIDDAEAEKVQRMVSEGLFKVSISSDGVPILQFDADAYAEKIKKSSKCRANSWRDCNDLPKDDNGNIKSPYRKYIVYQSCGWGWQVSGCGKKRRCYMGPCPKPPSKATNLKLNIENNEPNINNESFKILKATREAVAKIIESGENNVQETKDIEINNTQEIIVDGMQIFNKTSFIWKNGSWGKAYPNINKNSLQIYNNFYKNKDEKKNYLGGTAWLPERSEIKISIGNILEGKYICSSDILWRIVKDNGSLKSQSSWSKAKLINMAPEVTSIESTADDFLEGVDPESVVTFNIKAKGPFIDRVVTYVEVYDKNNNLIESQSLINIHKCKSKKSCEFSFNWKTPKTNNVTYKILSTAFNSCHQQKRTKVYDLKITNNYNININSYLINNLVDKDGNLNCKDDKTKNTSGSVTLVSKNGGYSATSIVNKEGVARFINIPESKFPLYIDANLESNDCREYNLYCVNNTDISDTDPIFKPNQKDSTFDISFGEIKKDPWTTFIDSDLYVKNININSGCESEIKNSVFDLNTISNSDSNLKGTLYSAEEIDSNVSRVIEIQNGNFVENLDNINVENKDSNDLWIEQFVFPSEEVLKSKALLINSIEEIDINNNIYYIAKDLEITDDFNYKTNGLSIIYVNGNLIINNSVVPQDSNSFVTFIVKGSILIGNKFGISDYTNSEYYNLNSNPNLVAGLIMLEENGSIEFVGTDDYNRAPDNPIYYEGLILSKGSVLMNRDLGRYNYKYPSIVVKSIRNFLPLFKELSSIQSTGMETFDLEIDYGY